MVTSQYRYMYEHTYCAVHIVNEELLHIVFDVHMNMCSARL